MIDLIVLICIFLFLFMILPVICFYVHIKSDKLDKLCRPRRRQANSTNWLTAWQCTTGSTIDSNENESAADNTVNDRQGNVLTIHDETSRENRYNDIFFIEPNSIEAARIRAQLEKDEKDLPSYEEVMRMANLSSPTAAPAPAPLNGGAVSMTASSSSVNTTETTLTVPEYTEVDLSSGPITPPPYSPPTAAAGAVVILPSTNNLHTQHITSSNV